MNIAEIKRRLVLVQNSINKINFVLDELGIDSEDDGTLIIHRSITADGKNSCRINGTPVTVGMLKSLGRELINIHGQHDSQRLLDSESHCSFIDEMADNAELINDYKSNYYT